MMTAQLNVRYRKPVPTNTPLIMRGWAGIKKGRVAHAHGEIMDENGMVLAEADGVYVDIPEEKIDKMDQYLSDWRVYPDAEEEK